MQQRTYSRVIWFSLLVFSMVHVCLPFVRGKLTSGHDTLRYIPRLVEFHENFRQGNAIPRWAPDLILGQGQPLFYFSPPLPYYVSEAWRIFFVDTLGTLNWGYISMILVSAISMFFLCSLFFGERGGVLGAVAYLYSPYFHVDLFVRGAYSEVSAMAFYPLALYGFARYAIEKDLRALLLGALAFAAVVLSHNPTALLIVPMLAAMAIYYAVEQRSKKLLAMQAAALAIGVSLAAFFWLPAIIEIGNVHAERLTGGYFDYRLHFVEFRQLVSTYWGYGGSVEGPDDQMSLSLGRSHVLLGLIALAASIWFRSAMQRVQWFFAAALVGFCILMLPVSAGIWQTVPLLQFTQFPWRLLGPAGVCLGVLIASLAAVSYENWRVNAIVGFAVSLVLLQNWHHAEPQKYVDLKPEDWTAEALGRRGVETTAMREFEPKWMKRVLPYQPEYFRTITGDANVTDVQASPTSWSAAVTAGEPSTLEARLLFFPGWSVFVDETRTHPIIAPETGRIRFEVPAGTHEIRLALERTPSVVIGNTLSVSGLAAIALVWLRRNRTAS